MPQYRLHYFNVRARGECCRLMLELAGVDWEDVRIPFEERHQVMATLKESKYRNQNSACSHAFVVRSQTEVGTSQLSNRNNGKKYILQCFLHEFERVSLRCLIIEYFNIHDKIVTSSLFEYVDSERSTHSYLNTRQHNTTSKMTKRCELWKLEHITLPESNRMTNNNVYKLLKPFFARTNMVCLQQGSGANRKSVQPKKAEFLKGCYRVTKTIKLFWRRLWVKGMRFDKRCFRVCMVSDYFVFKNSLSSTLFGHDHRYFSSQSSGDNISLSMKSNLQDRKAYGLFRCHINNISS